MSPLDRSLVRVGFALGLIALTALPAAAETDESYGYFRVIEGSATLMQGDGDRQPAEINQPVLAGDRIWVPERSRVEVVLADRNILRIDGGSEVTLEQLAASPDRDDPATVLRLQDGNILLTVTTDSLGTQLPRVDTVNATVYTQDFGTYRITATQDGFTEVTVRRGKAEVVTDRGSEQVRAEESAYVEGDRYARIEIEPAKSHDSLERWADRLEGEARYANNEYIDEDLRYHAAPLARHGAWIHVGGRPYWRPRVDVGWRPYWNGRWGYTPAGLTWISYEPWGWVPYHYGSWDYLPTYGWAWSPGRRWAPAWVYWYWGPSYVGWCPTGYYTSFYRHRYPYFHYGVYGWAGGRWDAWDHWSFIRHDYFSGYNHGYRHGYKDGFDDGRRRDHWDVRRYAVPRDEMRRRGDVERGVITTDTRRLRPDTWNEPREAIRVLTDQPVMKRIERGDDPRAELPDVTPFIQRRPDLPDTVVRSVVPREADQGGTGGAGGAGVRPRVADRPRSGTPWEGGVITTDPSDEPRMVRRERPTAGSGKPTLSEAPRVRTPQDGGSPSDAERPRVSRPQPGEGGGAPRPEVSSPRVRVPEEGDAPRIRRPESGSPGGAPRPQADENDRPRPQVRQPREDDGGRNDEVRSRTSEPEPRPEPESRPEPEAPSVRRPDPPQSYDAPRNREPEQRERERPDPPRSYDAPRSRDEQRQREAPPSSSSRPERREEARPSEPRQEESARPAEREQRDRGSSRGSESRGNDGGGRSGGSRGSRSRPPSDGDGGGGR